MRPVLIRWSGRPIYSFPAMLFVGLTMGLILGNFEANLRGVDGTRVYIASVLLVFPALVGARLLYVVGRWSFFSQNLLLIGRRSVGGQVMYGALLAVPFSVPLLRALGVPFWAFWDAYTFTALAAMAFGRVGCLLQGCCVGKTTTSKFGCVIRGQDGAAERRIPTQLLEAGLAAVLLGGITAIPADATAGVVFLAALGGYAAGRFLLEGTREIEGRIGGTTAHRWASALLGALALALLTALV